MVRIAALLLVIGGTLAAGPAAAQFGNIFGDTPPRPPADIPNGPFPQQPPPPAISRPSRHHRTRAKSPRLIPPPRRCRRPLRPNPCRRRQVLRWRRFRDPERPIRSGRWCPPGRRLPPRRRRIRRRQLRWPQRRRRRRHSRRAADRSTSTMAGRCLPASTRLPAAPSTFDAAIGETVQFGALQVTPRACYTRPPTEATNTDAFVEVDEVTLQGEIKRIFTGWMFASSPGLHAVEHPIYDVWLTDCASPIQTTLAEPAVQPAPAPARHPAPARQRSAPSVQAQPR